MSRRKADQLTDSEAEELEELYRQTYSDAWQEAFDKPLKYLHHDTGAHTDDELRLMASASGSLAIYGQYWCLMELLASRKGHMYDVSQDRGWGFLALDMSTAGVPTSADECRELVGMLAEFDKINREAFEGDHHIVSERVSRQAARYADEYATSKAAGAKSARKRALLSDKGT